MLRLLNAVCNHQSIHRQQISSARIFVATKQKGNVIKSTRMKMNANLVRARTVHIYSTFMKSYLQFICLQFAYFFDIHTHLQLIYTILLIIAKSANLSHCHIIITSSLLYHVFLLLTILNPCYNCPFIYPDPKIPSPDQIRTVR